MAYHIDNTYLVFLHNKFKLLYKYDYICIYDDASTYKYARQLSNINNSVEIYSELTNLSGVCLSGNRVCVRRVYKWREGGLCEIHVIGYRIVRTHTPQPLNPYYILPCAFHD